MKTGITAAKGRGADEHEVCISETFVERRSLDKIEGVEHGDFSACHIAALILQPRGQAGDHGSRDRLRPHVFFGEFPRRRIVVERLVEFELFDGGEAIEAEPVVFRQHVGGLTGRGVRSRDVVECGPVT